MLSDPQSVTIDGVATSLPAVAIRETETTYQSADGTQRLRVGYTENKNSTRYLVRYEEDVISADPISAVNAKKTVAAYLVIDAPNFGFTDDRVDDIIQGLKTWLSSATVLKVLGNQH